MHPSKMTEKELYELLGMCIWLSSRCEHNVPLDRLFMDAACIFIDEIGRRKPK